MNQIRRWISLRKSLEQKSVGLDKLLGVPRVLRTAGGLRKWFFDKRVPHLEEGQAQELLHLFHPRVLFFKTLPYGSRLLDVGAGDGSVHLLKKWLPPTREDVQVYAYGIEKGQHYEDLNGYELGHWPEKKPRFPGLTFNAIFSSHFIEHIERPQQFIAWCAARLPAEGRLYLEWPSPQALSLPTKFELAALGIDLMISNYRDDLTHRALPSREELLANLVEAGLFVEQTGLVRLPFLEDEVLAHAPLIEQDLFCRHCVYWSKTYWTQYIIATKLR